ncbi:hypothetical protein FB451DRAFT_624484 [Mycena latifolia]|nr:hypothetical protein FB451DRAFT_624484 [Mycena latifolia]
MDMDMDPSSSKWASSHNWASSTWASSSTALASPQSPPDWHTSPMLSSTASDSDDEFEHSKLTSAFRRRPHSTLPPFPTIDPDTHPNVAISVPANNTTTTKRQDVPLVNPSASFRPPSPAPRFNGFSSRPLPPDSNVSINSPSTRLRTSQVFASTQDLAAHYGIPQNLPPPPRPVTHRPSPPKPTPDSPTPDFNFMRDNYLTMLAHQPDTTAVAAPATTVAPTDLADTIRQMEDYIGTPPRRSRRLRAAAYPTPAASPEFKSLGDSFDNYEETSPAMTSFDDFANEPLFGGDDTSAFLTSPLFGDLDDFGTSPMDTPYSEFLPTPLMRDDDNALFTSPLMEGGGDLFGGAFEEPAPAAKPAQEPQQLWTMTGTPVLETAGTVFPAATTHTPVVPPAPSSAAQPLLTHERPGVTGTRKHLTPDALIPLDAPTQKRTYATPSATSRKAVPAAIAKKRAHSAAFPDADDEELEALSPTASEAEIIEHKRRQNTLAARKSRKRKLEHQRGLEDAVVGLRGEVARWRERALMAQEMLRAQGVAFSFE